MKRALAFSGRPIAGNPRHNFAEEHDALCIRNASEGFRNSQIKFDQRPVRYGESNVEVVILKVNVINLHARVTHSRRALDCYVHASPPVADCFNKPRLSTLSDSYNVKTNQSPPYARIVSKPITEKRGVTATYSQVALPVPRPSAAIPANQHAPPA